MSGRGWVAQGRQRWGIPSGTSPAFIRRHSKAGGCKNTENSKIGKIHTGKTRHEALWQVEFEDKKMGFFARPALCNAPHKGLRWTCPARHNKERQDKGGSLVRRGGRAQRRQARSSRSIFRESFLTRGARYKGVDERRRAKEERTE